MKNTNTGDTMLWSLSIYVSPACWYPVCCSLILVFPIDITACQPPSPEAFSVRFSVSLYVFFIKLVRFVFVPFWSIFHVERHYSPLDKFNPYVMFGLLNQNVRMIHSSHSKICWVWLVFYVAITRYLNYIKTLHFCYVVIR